MAQKEVLKEESFKENEELQDQLEDADALFDGLESMSE